MNFGIINRTADLKRIPADRDTVKRVTMYGIDNLYPQRMHQVLLLSPLAKAAVSIAASFIRGDGFENGDIVLNELGETANDILHQISLDQAEFNGYALHLNSNALSVVKTVEHIPFEFVRLGLADQRGRIRDVRVSNNWEQQNESLPSPNDANEQRYLIFDQEQNGREALTTARGMVYYSTPKKNHYPLAAIDAIVETCQAEHELSLFELGNIVNGFLSMSVFKYPSGGDTEEEEKELQQKLNQLKGAKNANSIIVAAIDEDSQFGDLVEQIPANNNDALFVNTTLNVRSRIQQNFAIPSSLLGTMPTGSFITSEQIADDFTYMNLRTKEIRNEIQRTFERLGLNVGRIIPNQFESSQMATNGNEQR